MDTVRKDWALLPIRLIFGLGFVIHGYPKLFGGHGNFTGMLGNMGIPLPSLAAWVVGIVEFFGGLLLIVGAIVTIVSILGIIDMLVALFVVHLGNGWSFTNQPPGIEVPLLYIVAFLALIIGGAGALSVDQARRKRPAEAPVHEVETAEPSTPDASERSV